MTKKNNVLEKQSYKSFKTDKIKTKQYPLTKLHLALKLFLKIVQVQFQAKPTKFGLSKKHMTRSPLVIAF